MARVLKSDDWTSRTVDDVLYLYHQNTGEVLVLNPSAAAVWNSLGEVEDTSHLSSALKQRYEDTGSLDADVKGLMRDFEHRGLVKIVSESGISPAADKCLGGESDINPVVQCSESNDAR